MPSPLLESIQDNDGYKEMPLRVGEEQARNAIKTYRLNKSVIVRGIPANRYWNEISE